MHALGYVHKPTLKMRNQDLHVLQKIFFYWRDWKSISTSKELAEEAIPPQSPSTFLYTAEWGFHILMLSTGSAHNSTNCINYFLHDNRFN